MSKHHLIIGEIKLFGEVEDDGTLAQRIADFIIAGFVTDGIQDVWIDFDLSTPDLEEPQEGEN